MKYNALGEGDITRKNICAKNINIFDRAGSFHLLVETVSKCM